MMLGKTQGSRRREQQRTRWLYGITNLMEMGLSKLQEIVQNREGSLVCYIVHGVSKIRHD